MRLGLELGGSGLGLLFRSGGWVGGWLENWRVKLIPTQVVVEVEVGVELGNNPLVATSLIPSSLAFSAVLFLFLLSAFMKDLDMSKVLQKVDHGEFCVKKKIWSRGYP